MNSSPGVPLLSGGNAPITGTCRWPLASGLCSSHMQPSLAVRLSAIKGKTKAYTELKPGQFEPNDVAKKVLRILKQNVSEEEEKALKGILNTTQVAASPGAVQILWDTMKAEYGDLKDRYGKMQFPESIDNLWHLRHLITTGDLVFATTFRSVDTASDKIRRRRLKSDPSPARHQD